MGFPLGIGRNTGNVFMGAVGSGTIADITPLGDNVNITARLSSESMTGEIFGRDACYNSPACKSESSQQKLELLKIKEKFV